MKFLCAFVLLASVATTTWAALQGRRRLLHQRSLSLGPRGHQVLHKGAVLTLPLFWAAGNVNSPASAPGTTTTSQICARVRRISSAVCPVLREGAMKRSRVNWENWTRGFQFAEQNVPFIVQTRRQLIVGTVPLQSLSSSEIH
ncbi:hypothetical protein MSAN_02270300 [Mycena sanguinolenta]|uniref:Secreted protein n=1 Tax=Mycena sanguinolenta TaxID=230812 RepID=A0A8H7CIH2_9AGAR|nr:hypothetical protein MSAN_02270300 [Mycena sanguinolenta]